MFADTFSVLLSGDETGGQFGMFVANCPRMQAAARTHHMRFLPGFEWPSE